VSEFPDLVIAKYDATANEFPGLNISSYPTLKWFPKEAKTIKDSADYKEGRELADFKAFFMENSDSYAAKYMQQNLIKDLKKELNEVQEALKGKNVSEEV